MYQYFSCPSVFGAPLQMTSLELQHCLWFPKIKICRIPSSVDYLVIILAVEIHFVCLINVHLTESQPYVLMRDLAHCDSRLLCAIQILLLPYLLTFTLNILTINKAMMHYRHGLRHPLYKSLFTPRNGSNTKHSNTNININKTKAATKSIISKWRFVLKYKHNMTTNKLNQNRTGKYV